ncbi:CGNR zinc finger domain-containing protein [Paenarthrobacter sp. PH39-S1]|uniref:CGNR zinc finger domain-containing protein n=1 Tax=Paenarthrobacter sp. PH39-S1 TaxID=3046204 RepID=UPI0024BAB8C1|nr:CGNR zinc finger domain-containing protein [Paenarthrobacter sp. PH39-S1]MDJ0356617.1 CGNR zinc finger domain-containing protein [Paenarthrobacter sp. PH39-S1]
MTAPYRPVQSSLALAEALLNGATSAHPGPWRQLAAAVGNSTACTATVNELLTVALARWKLANSGNGWRIALVSKPGITFDELAALQGLVLLVESVGWTRLKTCDFRSCGRVFLDWTNGGNRRGCSSHLHHPSKSLQASAAKKDKYGMTT